MRSELFRIPLEIAGVPLFSGALMVAWLAVAGYGLVAAAKEFGWKAAIGGHLPTLLAGVAMLVFLPRYFPDGVPVRGYGVMLIVGCTAAVGLAMRRAREIGVDQDEILRLAVAMFVAGIAGGRIFYVIEYWGDQFRVVDQATGGTNWPASLREVLNFTEGGLVVYGAFLGVMAAFLVQVRIRKLPPLAMADLIAPSLAVGLALGRVGCFLNGCCYGGESTAPWAVAFPGGATVDRFSPPYADQARAGRLHGFQLQALAERADGVAIQRVDPGTPAAAAGLQSGDTIKSINGQVVATIAQAEKRCFESIASARQGEQTAPLRLQLASGEVKTIQPFTAPDRSLRVHPTQLYSAINGGLLAWLLWSYFPLRRRDGEVIALLITLYPIARFLLESIRVDENEAFRTGLTISQNFSVGIFLFALCFWIWLRMREPKRPAFSATTAAVS